MKTITTKQLIKTCRKLHACESAMNWLEENKNKTIEELYASCDRGDWLLWLFAKLEIDRKVLVLAACDCAEIVLKYIPEGEDRPRIAIETARKWCRGEATLEEVKFAACAAYDAAYDTAYDTAYDADAACTAYAAAYAAVYAADAACAAYDTAYDAACAAYDTASRKQTLKQCANIARQHVSYEMFLELLIKQGD